MRRDFLSAFAGKKPTEHNTECNLLPVANEVKIHPGHESSAQKTTHAKRTFSARTRLYFPGYSLTELSF